jgi:hypothetical protein
MKVDDFSILLLGRQLVVVHLQEVAIVTLTTRIVLLVVTESVFFNLDRPFITK